MSKLEEVENLRGLANNFSTVQEAGDPRTIESKAAALYWIAWNSLAIKFSRRDEAKIPVQWRNLGTRASSINNSLEMLHPLAKPCSITFMPFLRPKPELLHSLPDWTQAWDYCLLPSLAVTP